MTATDPESHRADLQVRDVPASLRVLAGYAWRLLAIAIAVGVVVLALARLWLIVLPVVGALVIATALVPVASWLRRNRVPALLAAWLALLGAVVVVGGLGTAIAVAVVNGSDDFDLSVDRGLERVEGWLVDGPFGLSGAPLTDLREQAGTWLSSNAGGVSGQVIGGATLLFELVAAALLTVVLLFFFVKDGPAIWSWSVRQWPVRWRPTIDEAGRRCWSVLGSYLRGTAIVGAVDAVLIGIALAVIGVPFVIPLALVTFLGGFLPLVGATLAGLLAALVALVSGGVVDALLVLGVILVIQQVEGDLLAPYVLGRSLRLHPVAILVALAAGATLGGIIGAFLAVPLAASAYTVLEYARETKPRRSLGVDVPVIQPAVAPHTRE